jgi:acetaldehyde dehydrogenase (acetylating)
LAGVGRDYPLSIEKLCPVLSFYVVSDWREGCARCKQILRYGGMGHTMSIHSRNDEVILQFGLKKPAYRIVVNTPTTHGSIGLTTGLDPAMTLGCGGFGGNITSDNISPRHLLNTKRLAYEITPAVVSQPSSGAAARELPKAPAPPPAPRGVAAEPLARRIDEFLASRSYTAPLLAADRLRPTAVSPSPAPVQTAPAAVEKPADFVCEEDVRQALKTGRKITIGERTIVTPAARDLGEQHRLFIQAGWPISG